ncbi:GTP-binding protein [Corticibacter populi]|uniref:GTP-binding protein n=1 Tax=Corticibacter populi TaxID=1550736 RepID=A0A3M6R0A6_9BURK|nr:AAA family ATPase [Corticibacter populi]RMX08680.1 GTP-binding protein [Corticibacter populi]RZS36022.1 DNA repair exonuclease SbcCD ATPase subunit [Corticibacter populi]
MRLQRLRIEQFRQFHGPIEIDGLEPGINLFTGPNESGKSTLVRAIRAAFFERHRSSSAEELQPWGDSSASPAVELDFDWQGQRWQLRKRFLKQKRCDLLVDGQAFNGDDAEERLAELLGYQFPSRGASKAEHWGIPGLLWIEQGTGQDLHAAVGHAGKHLQSALGTSLGEVASSSGDALIAQVERERAALLTATGRPTGALARVSQQCEEQQMRLSELDTSIDTYRQQVDRLGGLRLQQQEDATRPWEAYRQQGRQAEAQLTEVARWQHEQQRAEQELQSGLASQQLCHDQLQAFERQQHELAERAKDRQDQAARLAELQARQSAIQTRLEQARLHYQQSRESLQQARHDAQRAGIQAELTQLEQTLKDNEARLQQARAQQTDLLQRRGQWQALHIDEASLRQLQKLHQDLSDLRVAEQAVATRLQFDLQAGQSLQLGHETIRGQGERRLLQPIELRIAGIGLMRIQPGGEDVASLVRRQQAVQDRINTLQTHLQVQNLSEAEARAEQCRRLQQAIEQDELQLRHLAPNGIDALEGQLTLARQRRQALSTQLAALPPATVNQTDSDTGIHTSLTAAQTLLDNATDQLRAAEQAEARYQKDLGLAEQASRIAQAEWQRLQNDIIAPERQQRTQQLQTQLLELRATESALRKDMNSLQQQIEAARPDILRQDIQRLGRTAEALEHAARERERELTRLQSSLEALGAQGLEEKRAELAQELQFSHRRRDELARRAAALDLLLLTLKDKRQALTRRLQAPLQHHLHHYLQLLFPQASLDIDENLMPAQLVRTGAGGHEERGEFQALSFGAREQMGLISRLAYADLLQAAGRPTLIILDDALVHSDPERLAPMKRILFDAAQRHQILLFTCHPANWRDLGAPPRDMQAIKTGA